MGVRAESKALLPNHRGPAPMMLGSYLTRKGDTRKASIALTDAQRQ